MYRYVCYDKVSDKRAILKILIAVHLTKTWSATVANTSVHTNKLLTFILIHKSWINAYLIVWLDLKSTFFLTSGNDHIPFP